MTPPNISFRPKSKTRFILPVLIVLLALGGALFAVGRKSTPAKKEKAAEKTPQVAFSITGFNAYVEKARPKTAAEDRKDLVTMFTGFYQAAFVDPAGWKDPTFASLSGSFGPEARASFAKDIGSLTIAEGRTEFDRVEPVLAQIKLSVYYDTIGRPAYAVAAVHFIASARTKAKRTVDVTQDATYRLQKLGKSWLIFSYQASAHQDTPSPTPSPAATASVIPTGSPS
jgi:hypothetical protein